MAVHWNIEDCADRDTIKADTPDGWPVTDCTIWLCLIVGIPAITPSNAERFYHRVAAWEQIVGPINTSGRRIEPQDVQRRVGLRTNASPMTDAQWRKKIAEQLHRESEATWRRTGGGTMSLATLEASEKEDA